MKEDQDAIQQELQRSLATPVNTADLAHKIATLLTSYGRRVDPRAVAQRLAEHIATRFTYKSEALQKLIKYRPKQLASLANQAANLASDAAWEEVKAKVLPIIGTQKKGRRKIKTQQERLRRKKHSKNRYESFERNYVSKPGAIEREFSSRPVLLSLEATPPTGPCLDNIFHGGRYKMSGRTDSLQWLFGLRRNRLSIASPRIQQGREIFYDYRGVLACMDALLKQAGPAAPWLPDPIKRQTVLAGIVFRVRKEAKPRIRKRFEKILLSHLK